jgi:hypothetical protein
MRRKNEIDVEKLNRHIGSCFDAFPDRSGASRARDNPCLRPRPKALDRSATDKVANFRVEPVKMGALLPGRSYDSIGALLEEAEGHQ